MADRATLAIENIQSSFRTPPETFLVNTEPIAGGGYQATGLTPGMLVQPGPCASPAYITGDVARPEDLHPDIRLNNGRDYIGAVSGTIMIMDGIEVVQPRYDLVAIQSYLTGNAWHYAAVKAKATAVAELGYEWVPVRKMQEGNIKPSTKVLEEFEERIYTRNHKDLASILREQAIEYFSTGNNMIEIAYNLGGKVDCLYSVPSVTVFRHPVLPIAVQLIPDWEQWFTVLPYSDRTRQTGLQVKAIMPLFMSGWTAKDIKAAFPDAPEDVITDNQLVHVANTLVSTDPFYGVADIVPALSAMMGDNAANDYNWQFFENNAIPRYAVTISGGRVTSEVRDDIKKFFNQEIQGRAHRTVIIPLPRDMTATFQALDATQNDASFIQFKKLNREEIAAVHGIAPSEIGLWESANKANSSQQSKNYYMKVIRPYQAKVEAMMNRVLKYGLGIEEYEFRFKNVEYTDDLERAQVNVAKATAYRNYMTGIAEVMKAIPALVTSSEPQASPIGGAGNGFGQGSNNGLPNNSKPDNPSGNKPNDKSKASDKTKQQAFNSGENSGGASQAPKMGEKPKPIFSQKDAQKLIKALTDKLERAEELFELDTNIDRWD